jgi:non-ribosomal peptide synthetase component F
MDAMETRPVMETRLEKLALEWAELKPESRAVVTEGECLTYRDLQLGVIAAAGRLNEIGLGRGDRIAISGQRSSATLIAMLAALSVGACVTPLDADWPKARSRAVLAMLKPVLLIKNLKGQGLRAVAVRGCVRSGRVIR